MNSNHQIITDKYEMHEIVDCILFFEKDSNEEKENKEIFKEIFAKTQLKFQPKETIKITL